MLNTIIATLLGSASVLAHATGSYESFHLTANPGFTVQGEAEGSLGQTDGYIWLSIAKVTVKSHPGNTAPHELIGIRVGFAYGPENERWNVLAYSRLRETNVRIAPGRTLELTPFDTRVAVPDGFDMTKYWLVLQIRLGHEKYDYTTTYAHDDTRYEKITGKPVFWRKSDVQQSDVPYSQSSRRPKNHSGIIYIEDVKQGICIAHNETRFQLNDIGLTNDALSKGMRCIMADLDGNGYHDFVFFGPFDRKLFGQASGEARIKYEPRYKVVLFEGTSVTQTQVIKNHGYDHLIIVRAPDTIKKRGESKTALPSLLQLGEGHGAPTYVYRYDAGTKRLERRSQALPSGLSEAGTVAVGEIESSNKEKLLLPDELMAEIKRELPMFSLPKESDAQRDDYYENQTFSFVCRGDFDGSGTTDIAAVLVNDSDWRIAVFHRAKNGSFNLEHVETQDTLRILPGDINPLGLSLATIERDQVFAFEGGEPEMSPHEFDAVKVYLYRKGKFQPDRATVILYWQSTVKRYRKFQ